MIKHCNISFARHARTPPWLFQLVQTLHSKAYHVWKQLGRTKRAANKKKLLIYYTVDAMSNDSWLGNNKKTLNETTTGPNERTSKKKRKQPQVVYISKIAIKSKRNKCSNNSNSRTNGAATATQSNKSQWIMRLESGLLHANEVRSCKNQQQQQQRSCVSLCWVIWAHWLKLKCWLTSTFSFGATFITFQRAKNAICAAAAVYPPVSFVRSLDSRIAFSLPILVYSLKFIIHPSKWVTLFSGTLAHFSNGGIDFRMIQFRRARKLKVNWGLQRRHTTIGGWHFSISENYNAISKRTPFRLWMNEKTPRAKG